MRNYVTATVAGLRGTAARFLAISACLLLAGVAPAFGQGALKAHYRISMTGVTIGYVDWLVDIDQHSYQSTANGEAGGLFSILFSGEGVAKTAGTAANGQLSPSLFTFQMKDDEGPAEFRVTFKDGIASEESTRHYPPAPDRVPITDNDRRNVLDPLTAVLVSEASGVEALAPKNCNRVLRIFDGRRRYDLTLSFIRIDRMALARSYNGPALVCQVILRPVGGYRPDSKLVTYVAGRRDMELWFAPINGTAVLAPLRVAMPTLLGTLQIEADHFESVAATQRPPAPARGVAPR
jgi:hypothetical protein